METNFTNKKVLVVDDDVDFLTQMKLQLEGAGFTVVTAGGQHEAEEILTTMRPDLAILDLMMENLDGGFSLSNRIKKMDDAIPVIICTAVSSALGMKFDAATEEERAWVKADVVLNKPVRFEQLMREIKRFFKE